VEENEEDVKRRSLGRVLKTLDDFGIFMTSPANPFRIA
jgi:hypothetical protein